MPYIVGLTGGIGSGKSAVADLFAQHGVTLVDTDLIAHALSAPGGAAIAPIAAAFGAASIAADGSLDRVAMRRLVFGNAAAKARLEGILHPLIRKESERQCQAATSPYVLWVVPLLVESGNYRRHAQRILVVDCPEALQIERVMARNHMSADEVRAIMATQASRAERLAAADDIIVNDGSLAELAPDVANLHRRYLTESGCG